jgi:hypothetical protein
MAASQIPRFTCHFQSTCSWGAAFSEALGTTDWDPSLQVRQTITITILLIP